MIRRRALTLASLRHQPESYRNTNTTIPRLSSLSAPNPNRKRLFSSSSKLSQTQSRIDIRCLVSHHYSPLISISINRVKNGNLGVRSMATRTMNDSSNRPPKETILLDGCDFEHWLVVLKAPDPNLTRDEIIESYIKTLTQVLGSEEEARMKIYSVSTRHYFAFGCIVSEEVSYKIKELPNVTWVLPDSYFDVKNKDYGGEPFINGQAVPYDPRYHEVWVRNHNDSLKRNSNNKNRPRREDRTRNIQRRDNMMSENMRPPPPLPPSQPNPPSASNNNFTPTPNYQNQSPPPMSNFSSSNIPAQNMQSPLPPPSTPNPAPSLPNQNFAPTPNYQSQDPLPSRDMPLQMQNHDVQRTGIPPQAPNSNFQNRDVRPSMQSRDYQNSYAQSIQNRDFQSRETPPPMANGEVPNRHMPPPTHNWNYQSNGMRPPSNNFNFQDRDVLSQPKQNNEYLNRDIPPPMHNQRHPNGDVPPSQQNQNFYNRNVPHPIENHDLRNRGMSHPVQHQGIPYKNMGNIQPGDYPSCGSDMGVMPNGEYQNRGMPRYTSVRNEQNQRYHGGHMSGHMNTGNVQGVDRQGWSSSNATNMGNSPSRDYQSGDIYNGEFEAVANKNF